MARKKRGHRPDIISKVFKGVFKIGSKLLISGPVTVPGALAIKAGLSDPNNAIPTFVFEASGYNMNANSLDTSKLTQVLTRDLVLVGVGMGLRWAGRHV